MWDEPAHCEWCWFNWVIQSNKLSEAWRATQQTVFLQGLYFNSCPLVPTFSSCLNFFHAIFWTVRRNKTVTLGVVLIMVFIKVRVSSQDHNQNMGYCCDLLGHVYFCSIEELSGFCIRKVLQYSELYWTTMWKAGK